LATNLNERRLGLVIKRRREQARLSQEDFAELAQVHRTYVSQLERGIKSPSVRVLIRIAGALDCEAWEMLRQAGAGSGPKS
jgi:transcriptional regulator with XRE-family HTH domain